MNGRHRNLKSWIWKLLLFFPIISAVVLTYSFQTVNAACLQGIDPVGYWRLDENVPGTDTNFSASFGTNAATCGPADSGCPGQTLGELVVNSQSFTGGDASGTGLEIEDFDDDFDWDFDSSFAISAWVKANGNSGTDVIVGRNDGDDGASLRWFIALTGTGQAQGYIEARNGETVVVNGNTTLTDNAWHHVVLVRDGSTDQILLYVDGLLEVSAIFDFTDDISGEQSFESTEPVTIGWVKSGAGFRLVGLIDEVAIYSQVVPSHIIAQQYLNGMQDLGYCDPAGPTILSQPINAVYGVEELEYQVKITGNPLPTFALGAGTPEGVSIDTTGILTWQPMSSQISASAYNVSVTATNSEDTGTGPVDITVIDPCGTALVGYWKLDEEDTDLTFFDSSTTGSDGTRPVLNQPVSITGQIDGAQDFSNDATAAIAIPDNDAYDWSGGSFTISAWVNTTSAAASQTIVDRYTAGTAWRLSLATGKAQFDLSDGSTSATVTDIDTINDGNWHHLMAVRDASAGKNFLYVDGVLVAQATVSYTGFDIASGLTIGNSAEGAGFGFAGLIDEVALFNTALSIGVADQLVRTTDRSLCNSTTTITSTAPSTATEDTAYSYTPTVSNPDGDTLTWSITGEPTGMTFSTTTGLIDWTPLEGVTTSGTFTITVDDGFGGTDTESITIAVTAVNDAPVINTTAVTTASELAAYSYNADATDAEDDTLTWTLTQNPAGMTVDAGSGVVSWTPPNGTPATVDVTLEVSDGNPGGTDTQSFTISVSDASNQAPTITTTAPSTATENIAYSYAPAATDPEGDTPLTWSITGEPTGMTFNTATGRIDWTPGVGVTTSGTFTITVADPSGGQDTETITIAVSAAGNNPPEISTTAVTTATELVAYTYDADATDAEDDTLTWALTQSPTGMTVDSGTGVVSWTPPEAGAASVDVTLEVSDGNPGGTDTQSFTITVSDPTNQAPTITSTAPDTATEGVEYQYTPTADDADGDTLTWSLSGAPTGMVVDTDLITWTPSDGSAGDVTFTVTVSDGFGGSDSETVTVTVSAGSGGGGGGGGGSGCFIDSFAAN